MFALGAGLKRSLILAFAGSAFCLLVPHTGAAQELYRASPSSQAQADGGTSVTSLDGPLDAMSGNPAELVWIDGKTLEAGAIGGWGNGRFTNPANTDGRLNAYLGAAPFGAFAAPLVRRRVYGGFAVTPDTSMSVTWHYFDSPGAAGADYGYQKYHSELENLRFAGGLGVALTSRLSLGGTAGLVYNANTLTAPFIFQSQPVLAGLKTLLNMHTTGTGWNATAGALYAPRTKLRLGAAYKSRTVTHTSGQAMGDLSAQLAALGISGVSPSFHYNAKIDNTLPDVVSLGLTAPLTARAAFSLEDDLVRWRGAFRTLPVRLSDGSNSDLNSLVGSASLVDVVPLDWHNQNFIRAGVSVPFSERTRFAGGYAFANDPVPSATLTPLTASISRQFITAGVEYSHRRFGADIAYEAGLPQSAQVKVSRLLSGEYSNSMLHLSLQTVSLTTAYRF